MQGRMTTMEKLTIGRLANSAGTYLETIRYYERIGLMPEPGAPRVVIATTQRRAYDDLRFAIEDIRALLELAEPGRMSCGEVQRIAALHFHNVRAKLADLAKMEKLLAKTVAQCRGKRSRACPVLEMLDTPQNGA